MRVLSVVLIFATLALFGVTAQSSDNKYFFRKCTDAQKVCIKYGDIEYTTTKCVSEDLVKYAKQVEGKVISVTDGACAVHTLNSCASRCERGEPICYTMNGTKLTIGSLCDFFKLVNCAEAEKNNGSTFWIYSAVFELVRYGKCPKK